MKFQRGSRRAHSDGVGLKKIAAVGGWDVRIVIGIGRIASLPRLEVDCVVCAMHHDRCDMVVVIKTASSSDREPILFKSASVRVMAARSKGL